jgi:L-iditol 2-dehydrogenase
VKAVYLTAPEAIEIRTLPEPVCGPDDVLVRVRAGGVCGTDVSTYLGTHFLRKPPVILGHEVAGEIAAVGVDVTAWAVGERVAIDPQVACGRCSYCATGTSTQCPEKQLPGLQLPGLFSEIVAMPTVTLHRLGDGMTWEQGAMVEPAAVAYHALQRAELRDDARVAILGAGPIGALAALIHVRDHDIAPMVVDVKQANLDRMEALTGCVAVNPAVQSVVEAGLTHSAGRGFDAVLVANTAPQSLQDAVALVRPEGRVVAIGAAYAEPPTVDVPMVVWRELELRGSFAFTSDDFRRVLAMIEEGLNVTALLTQRYPLEEAHAAFERLGSGADGIKTMLSFD